MSTELILYETRGPLALVTLNRPDKLNAINAAMVRLLNEALDRAEADEAVRVILLCGAGRAFSAGFDLSMGEGDPRDPDFLRRELSADFNIIMRFWHSPKPTIAAVHGYCLGSAMEMAAACDVSLAATGCRFGAPEVRFGSGIVALLLPWLIGPKRSKELLLTGDDRVTAERAEAMGLVNRVVASDALLDEALGMARTIAGNDQVAVQATKRAINDGYELAGMTAALQQALQIDVLVEATETEESRTFNEILKRDGAKAAIKWRRGRADDGS